MSEPFIGQIMIFGGNFAPRGWALCQGQLMSIAQNTALFSILGTTFGGDGRVTFGLPDLRGRSAVGSGSGPGLTPVQLGEMGGVESVTILNSNMPAHTHALMASTAGGTVAPTGNFMAVASDSASGTTYPSYAPTQNTALNPQSVGLAGGNIPIPIRPPYLGMTFCIATEGIFPSRN